MVRTVVLPDLIVNGQGVAQANISVTLTLLPPPGAGPLLDLNGEVIDLTPLVTTTNASGQYSQAVIAPGDITPAGAQWQVSYLSTTLISPSFAYSATPIAPSSWAPVANPVGLIKMYLTLVEANASPDQGARLVVAPANSAVWYWGAGKGQVLTPSGSVSLSADSTGSIAAYLPPSRQLSPLNTPYTVVLPGGTVITFIVPAAYTNDAGAWVNTTAYTVGQVVEVNGVPYICLAANTGDSPPSSPTQWGVYSGERILANLVAPGTVGIIVMPVQKPTLGFAEILL